MKRERGMVREREREREGACVWERECEEVWEKRERPICKENVTDLYQDIYTHTHARTHAHTHTHTHIYIYIYIYIYITINSRKIIGWSTWEIRLNIRVRRSPQNRTK